MEDPDSLRYSGLSQRVFRSHTSSWSQAPGEDQQDQEEEEWTLEDLEALVRRRLRARLGNVRASLRGMDQRGTGRVDLQGFTELLGSLLALGPRQIAPLVHKVCRKNCVAVDYMGFLRMYSRVSSSCSARYPAMLTLASAAVLASSTMLTLASAAALGTTRC
ncbi:hypothetical protein NHX12_020387 [Muraenolepis orangiensis]|uniref:EF-hand domain-containing protein n=1 Tax=Muraenolepis orangiensis TaxID=630683 RepID=A0A9Q0EUT3_9TELE|nr:hypothetical protein NHX12_020387 [Muraenolepis orangiensis]